MAAYAALVTLINLIEDLQNHPRLSTSLHENQLESLCNKARLLLNFIEACNSRGEAKVLELRIASAAQKAEDAIESCIVDRIRAGDGGTCCCFLFRSEKEKVEENKLRKVIEEMDSIIDKIEEEAGQAKDESQSPLIAAPSRPLRAQNKATMVGIDDELRRIMELLTGDQSEREIIPIIGLCGIGKTSLAKTAFENPHILHRFDIRAWATTSIKPSFREICHQLLSGHEKSDYNDADHKLAEKLHKTLYGRRYLVVIDDVWDFEVLDSISSCLPDNDNGSRIVITSRLIKRHRLYSYSFNKNTLDTENSWKLFCTKAFGEDDCPSELEGVGRKIVEQCRGLPLSIVVIGGYLSKSSREKEYWENVSANVNSVLGNGEDERCLKILSLSYNHLPAHLKPCFLYTGVFPEDGEILVSKLIQLWVAEGFIKKPNDAERLEEIAEGYLEDLADRNLVIVDRRGQCGNIVACKIHVLLRELCIKMAREENILRVLRLRQNPSPLDRERRVAIHGGTVDHKELFDALKSASLVRSLIFDAGVDNLPSDLKLLKIVSVIEEGSDVRRLQLLQSGSKFLQRYVNLRYLHDGLLTHNHSSGRILKLPSSISRLWNLQTLILGGNFHAPPQIWKMASLRHLICNRILLPDPPSTGKQKRTILQNLQTLSEAEDFRLSEEVCARTPNIKNLRMFNGYLNELQSLTKLESLTCEFSSEEPVISDFPQLLEFPSSLVELCLIKCYLGWEDLSAIGSLPCLQVLKLGYSIKGNDWNPIEGEFKHLKHLEIWGWDDLINWNAEWSHFPVLKSLTLKGLTELSQIPLDIGYIPTLESIKLDECSVSAAVSAARIVDEQRSCGNEDLQLQVCFRNQENCRMFREMVEEEGFNINHFRLVTI